MLTKLLCSSKDGPLAHIVLLVDKTDPLTFTQGKEFSQILEDFAKIKYVREGELLSVFVLGEDFKQTADPIFEKCNPGDGSNQSMASGNPKLWKQMFEDEYLKPLVALESELKSQTALKQSPILQMLQVVALRFAKYNVQGPRRLYIVSDMLHHTPDLSLFREQPDFLSLTKRPAFARLRAKLDSVDTTVFLLLHKPQLQTIRLSKFWEDYFRDMGGSLQKFDPIHG